MALRHESGTPHLWAGGTEKMPDPVSRESSGRPPGTFRQGRELRSPWVAQRQHPDGTANTVRSAAKTWLSHRVAQWPRVLHDGISGRPPRCSSNRARRAFPRGRFSSLIRPPRYGQSEQRIKKGGDW